MSQSQLDSIIKKYSKTVVQRVSEAQYTERKRDPLTVTFMDNNHTPTKDMVRETRHHGSQFSVNSYGDTADQHKMHELLRLLDQNQIKLAVSEKNYADINRKYQKIRQSYQILTSDLQKQRKGRLQQLIDTKNKLDLLQSENDRNILVLQQKQQTIAILKQKLCQKQQQIGVFEQQLQEISRKLFETLQMRSRESINLFNKQLSINCQQANKSLESYKDKYEKNIASLKEQLNKFNGQLIQKQKQKKKLLTDMEQMAKNHMTQLKDLKLILQKNQQQYKNWLDEAKKQKLQTIEKYQNQLSELHKCESLQKITKSSFEIEQSTKNKSLLRDIQAKLHEIQKQNKGLKFQREEKTRQEKQLQLRHHSLNEEFKFIKGEYVHQIGQNKKLLAQLKSQEERNEIGRKKISMLQVEIQAYKAKLIEADLEKKKLMKQIQSQRETMQKQLKSLVSIKKQLSQCSNNELNLNSTLTQASTRQHKIITELQSQLQNVRRQLYAQRLEKAKLAQQLQETKVQLKRQYQLSIQNTKKQLIQQIDNENKNRKQGNFAVKDPQKQQLYLKMFKLERQYELLKCEVITSDEMLKMGTKMGKYYQKRTK